MALVVKDRVKETTATTGLSDFVLGGTTTGFQSFSVIGNANTTYYTAVDPVTGDWEVGVGTYSTTGPTLTRDTILESSAGGSKVNFGGGNKDVFCTYPAEKAVMLNETNNVTALGTVSSGTWQGSAVAVAYGGTGQTSYTNGQLLIGNTTGNTLTKATLTAGSGISISNGTGSITISSTVSAPCATPTVAGKVFGRTESFPFVRTALGSNAGGSSQGCGSVAIGQNAGSSSQGSNAVAIGRNAGQFCQASNSIAIGLSTQAFVSCATYMGPLRYCGPFFAVYYNPCTRELTYY